MAKKKTWSGRVVKRAREIIEFNMQNPMVRDDARVVSLEATKAYDVRPRLEINVRPVELESEASP